MNLNSCTVLVISELKTDSQQIFSPLVPSSRYSLDLDGQFYFLHKERKSWNEAQSVCQKEMRGASLATILHEETMQVVHQIFSRDPHRFWLGGSDAQTEGKWQWIQPFHNNPYFKEFIQWNRQEPNGGEKENCIAYDNGLFDISCNSRYPFLCQLSREGENVYQNFLFTKIMDREFTKNKNN